MLYIIPTKKGIGVELWGTYEDLKLLYDVIGKFWNDEEQHGITGYKNKGILISGFSYELRHAFQGDRLTKSESHFFLIRVIISVCKFRGFIFYFR